jgi:signal transduction histidine kinase
MTAASDSSAEERDAQGSHVSSEGRILEMVATGVALSHVLDGLCRLVEERTPGVLTSILLLDGDRLRHGGAPSLPKAYTDAIDGAVIGPTAASCGTAAYRAQPVIVADITTDPLWADCRELALPHGLRACWSTPIFASDGAVIATFAMYFREPRSPSPRDQQIVAQITHLAGIAIQRKLDEDKLRESENRRERAEEALHRAQAELAHVTRLTTLGQLAASIAHEVNQPLAAIVADANASLNWLAAAEPELERVRETLTAIATDGHRAADVIQRIRQLATKTEPRKARLDVDDVLRDVVALVRAEVARYEITLALDSAPSLPSVVGDRVQLQQVVLNLVMNAIEAMAPVTDRPRQLVIRSERHDDEGVRVAVHDTGVGLRASEVDRVFGAFFTTKPGGMGMGLSISRSIIEAHGGRLWAAPNAPHGTIFQFSLPGA